MRKKSQKEGSMGEIMGDSIGPRREDEARQPLIASFATLSLVLLLFSVVCSYHFQRPELTQPTAFTVKGATAVNTEIDGETHHFVCYSASVSEFWLSAEPEQADLIGAEEKFTALMRPDGTKAYCSTYYEALDENRGLKVCKEFMDCGTGDQAILLGREIPLSIMFNSGASHHAGILDEHNKPTIAILTVTFD